MNDRLVAAAVPCFGEKPDAALARIDNACERLTTPCGSGEMVWRRWGSGAPLVLLHGAYGSWRHWIRTVPAFASHRSVLVPDLPGMGDSDDIAEPVTLDSIAAIIVDGLEHLGLTATPIDLVGFSFGAAVAGHVAALLGPGLRSLTLVGAGALGTRRGDVKLVKWQPGMPAAELRKVHHTNLSRVMFADIGKIDELAVSIQEVNTRRARLKSRKLTGTDALAQALRRSAPKRFHAIWGECDAPAGAYLAEREAVLRSIRPDLQLRLIPGAGHWVAYEDPASFNLVLNELLANAGSAG